MSEEILINVNIQGDGDVNKVDKSIEKLGKTTNKTQTEIQKLRRELRDSKSAMLEATEGSDAYNRALQRSSEIQQRLTDVNKQVRAGMLGIGEVAVNVGKVTAGLAGGFGALTGTLTLLGIENEDVLKSMQRLQATMSVVQGISTFADSIDALQELMRSLNASTAIASASVDGMNKPVTEMGAVSDDAAKGLSNLSKEATVVGSNLAAVGTISEKVDDSLKNLPLNTKKSLDELVNQSRGILGEIDDVNKKIIDLNENVGNGISVPEFNKQYEDLNKQLTALNDSYIEIEREIADYNIEQENANKVTGKSTETTKKLTSATDSFGKTVIKTIGTMAAFTLIIAGVFYGIEKLIELLNETPEDLDIKLKLDEEAIKSFQKETEIVNKWTRDYNKALKENDKERIKSIENIAKKEFNINDEKLKQIKKQKDGWNTFFKDYLKMVEDAAYDEAIIKQRVNLQIEQKIKIAQRETILQSIREKLIADGKTEQSADNVIKGIRKGMLGALPILQLGISGLVKEWNKVNDEIKQTNTNLSVVNRLNFRNVGNLLEIKQPEKPKETPKNIEDRLVAVGVSKFTNKDMEDYAKNLAKRIQTYVKKELNKTSQPIDLASIFKPTDPGLQLTPFDTTIIGENVQNYFEKERYNFEQQMSLYQDMVNSISSLSDSIVDLYDARLTAIDNYYSAEARLIENSTLSEEEKNKRLSVLDQERYEKQKELFEQQKNWQKALVYLNLASGLMNVVVRATDPKNPFPVLAWIAAGLETAALIGQSVASIAQINAQELNAPSGGGGDVVSFPNISGVNPNQTSLITKEENLNMMNNASQNLSNNIVRVSEINEVQSKVSVREKNQNF